MSSQGMHASRVALGSRLAGLVLPALAFLALAAAVPFAATAQESDTEKIPVDTSKAAGDADGSKNADANAAESPAAALRQDGLSIGRVPTTPLGVAEAMGWHFTAAFIVASVLLIWFSVERLVVLRRGRVIPRAFVNRFLEHLQQGKLDPEQALKVCEGNPSPIAAVFAHGVRKWGKPSVEVEQAIIDGGERQVSQLRSHLRLMNGISTITPLIGLLGTVVGMIQSFNAIANADAAGRSETLAIGIALALLTTAVGLLIAIPALCLYMYFAGKVDTLVSEMDTLAQNVVLHISAEALSESPIAAARPRPRRAGEKERETA